MRRTAAALLALLAGCSGNSLGNVAGPSDGAGGSPSDPVAVPAVLSGDLAAAAYEPGSDTIAVDLRALDASPRTATYVRAPALDVPGFEAYALQESTGGRRFVALFAQGTGGTTTAGTAGDGGQFGTFFAGTTYSRTGAFSLPVSGLALYRGSYAGLLNAGSITADGGRAPYRTTGTATLQADFTDGVVNGGIKDRRVVDTGQRLGRVNLIVTDIAPNGTFAGRVQFPDLTEAGDYGGIFGGTGAREVAGAVVIRPDPDDGNLLEHGTFSAACASTGAGVPCP